MRETSWYAINVCPKCEKRLKDNLKYYSGGVCPKCGHLSSGTICDTESVIIKEVAHHKWWKFWDKKFTYKAKDEFSKKWIIKNGHILHTGAVEQTGT